VTAVSRTGWAALAAVAFGTGAMSNMREPRVSAPAPGGVAVRYPEGTAHGFLVLTTDAGTVVAHGDLLQLAANDGIASRMVFHFADGSVFEESATFGQQGVFALKSYHLVQSGPAFADDLDATLSHSGVYAVKTKSHKDGAERRYDGTLDMPGDVYNGMIPIIVKNVSTRQNTSVHVVAFSPEPRMVTLELAPSAVTETAHVGGHEETEVNFALKPQLAFFLHIAAKLTGKMPADSHMWVVTDEVPAFARFEGPLYTGPVRRIALASPLPLSLPTPP
jgi:hypothetical protein